MTTSRELTGIGFAILHLVVICVHNRPYREISFAAYLISEPEGQREMEDRTDPYTFWNKIGHWQRR